MIRYTLIYMSGDRRRTFTDTIAAADIDVAARSAMDDDAMRARFGAGASWFLAGIVQEDTLSEVVRIH